MGERVPYLVGRAREGYWFYAFLPMLQGEYWRRRELAAHTIEAIDRYNEAVLLAAQVKSPERGSALEERFLALWRTITSGSEAMLAGSPWPDRVQRMARRLERLLAPRPSTDTPVCTKSLQDIAATPEALVSAPSSPRAGGVVALGTPTVVLESFSPAPEALTPEERAKWSLVLGGGEDYNRREAYLAWETDDVAYCRVLSRYCEEISARAAAALTGTPPDRVCEWAHDAFHVVPGKSGSFGVHFHLGPRPIRAPLTVREVRTRLARGDVYHTTHASVAADAALEAGGAVQGEIEARGWDAATEAKTEPRHERGQEEVVGSLEDHVPTGAVASLGGGSVVVSH
jgi:hypothetical protein